MRKLRRGIERKEKPTSNKYVLFTRRYSFSHRSQLERCLAHLQSVLGVTLDQLETLQPPWVRMRELEAQNSILGDENKNLRSKLAGYEAQDDGRLHGKDTTGNLYRPENQSFSAAPRNHLVWYTTYAYFRSLIISPSIQRERMYIHPFNIDLVHPSRSPRTLLINELTTRLLKGMSNINLHRHPRTPSIPCITSGWSYLPLGLV